MKGLWRLQALNSLFCVIFGVFLGLALAENLPAEDWLNRWQTLLAGLLAVAAAAVTVLQMERTDSSQNERHNHLVALTLRTDRLAFQRLWDMHNGMLTTQVDGVGKAVSVIDEARETIGSHMPIETLRSLRVLDNSYFALRDMFDDDHYKACEVLFEGKTLALARMSLRQADACRNVASYLRGALDVRPASGMMAADVIDAEWKEARQFPATLAAFVSEFRGQLSLYN